MLKTLFIVSFISFGLLVLSCKSEGAGDTTSGTGIQAVAPPKGIPYQIDIPRSELKWSAFKPTATHHGMVPITGGTIYVDGDLISGGSIELNMSGLTVQDMDGAMKDKLENHLKGTIPGKENDFFNVVKYPTATFTILNSVKLENDPLGTHLINGQLRIKDITNPVSFKARVDMSIGVALKAVAEPFVIDRTKWDIRFKSRKFFDNLKDDFVNDEIRIELTVGALKVGE